VFMSLLKDIKNKHEQLVALAETINVPVNDDKFYSWILH
jgi:hypothetical protein